MDGWNTDCDQQAGGSKDGVFQSDAATIASADIGQYLRRAGPASPKVRSCELVDEHFDYLPTVIRETLAKATGRWKTE